MRVGGFEPPNSLRRVGLKPTAFDQTRHTPAHCGLNTQMPQGGFEPPNSLRRVDLESTAFDQPRHIEALRLQSMIGSASI